MPPQETEIETLTRIAFTARMIMEDVGFNHRDPMFEAFPRGCCGPTCELLGRFLVEQLQLDAKYVCAERHGDRGYGSHAWLVVGDIIIDITADQFGLPPVVVARRSLWHEEWEPEAPRAPICTQQQWPMYPAAAWIALREGLTASGLTGW